MRAKLNENDGGEGIPYQIKDNLTPSEELLHQARWRYIKPIYKIYSYSIIGMAIFTSIFLLYAFSRGSTIITEFWSVYLFMVSFVFIFIFFMFRKSPFRKEFCLVITDKKLYLYTKAGRVDSIDSIDLTSIKAALFKKKRYIKKNEDIGKIVLISNDLNKVHKNKIEIQNIKNLKFAYQKLESILWHFGNLKERINMFKSKNNIHLPYTFEIEQQTFNRYTRYRRIFDYLIIICIIAIGIGFIGIFLQFNFMIIVIFILFGGGFVGLFVYYRYMISKVLTPLGNQFNLEESNVKLNGDEFSNIIPLSDEINLDYVQLPDFKKSSTGSFEVVGAVIIKESLDSSKMIKFGPIFKFYDFLEVIYLSILNWKGEQRLLLTKEQLQTIKKEEIKFKY